MRRRAVGGSFVPLDLDIARYPVAPEPPSLHNLADWHGARDIE